MPDIAWPPGLVPHRVAFYLQPHVGGTESPLTRVRKTYGLSAPRWLARLSFRGGYDGAPQGDDPEGYGPLLDALIGDLHGGLVKTRFHDWRRPRPTRAPLVTGRLLTQATTAGSSVIRVSGFAPRGHALSVGDYVGGDGRPHLVSAAATIAAGGNIAGAGSLIADANGMAIIGINPPLSASIAGNTPLAWPVTGRFELVGEDAGQNETHVGDLSAYTLDFVEALL